MRLFKRKPIDGPQAVAAINSDLAKAAKKSGGKVFTIRELRKTSERYPHLVPTLIGWVDNLGSRTDMPVLDEGNILDALYRTLMTPDAPSDVVMHLGAGYMESHPDIAGTLLSGVSNALSYHAMAEDMDTMIRLARDRELTNGRSFILEWLIDTGDTRAIDIACGELDDSSVAGFIFRQLAKRRAWPEGTREAAERWAEVPPSDSEYVKETKKQARRLLQKMDKFGS